MIVPHSRLLFWVALVVIPSATLLGLLPGTAMVWTVLLGVFAALVICDALLARRALAGISVQLPEVVRLSKDRPGAIGLRFRNDQRQERQLRVGLDLPVELRSVQNEILTQLPGGVEFSRVEWECTPTRRGRHFLKTCYLEASSPIGLWLWRSAAPVSGEIRVYPNLLQDRRNLAALFLNRVGLGIHTQRQVGQGREFEKLREYIPGDSFDDIHWKATAKRSHPITKTFQIERTQEVYVVIDASRLSGRPIRERLAGKAISAGSPSNDRLLSQAVRDGAYRDSLVSSPPILERFITSALILGLVAQRQGDSFGVLSFSDRILTFLRARTGKAHYSACRDALYTLQPRIVTPDYEELFSFIRLRLRHRALLVFLTDLDDPVLAETFSRNLEIISRQHLILVQMLRPWGVKSLFSENNVGTVDEIYDQLAGHLQWEKLRELERVLKRRGVYFSLLDQETLSAQIVTQYMNVKQRQMI
jgi:uncharacterized protein (DUF58 family)